MPGRSKSDPERRLAARWRDASKYQYPVLRGISIDAGGLRGLTDLTVEFRFPLTVVTGQNGSGKSTLLALAALAFHTVPGHMPLNALRPPRRNEDSTYYTFGDFFFRGWGDDPATGLAVTWRYEDRNGSRDVRFKRTSERKWMKYERRPRRPVHYIGISRAVPAIERRALRGHFPSSGDAPSDHLLDASATEQISRVLGRPYQELAVRESQSHSIRRAATTTLGSTRYSSFNMGAGEDCVVELFHILNECPVGSLIVIEELELGLHPAAVARLAPELVDLCLKRGLQIVTSTHSAELVDMVPREARILLQRGAPPLLGPSARHALGELTGSPQRELLIACEDEFATRVIEESLSGGLRRRCRVSAIGSKEELAQFAKHHVVSAEREQVLIVWDGDVRDSEIHRMTRGIASDDRYARVHWMSLPGDLPPEAWALEQLGAAEGLAALARELNDSELAAGGYLASLATRSNHHDLGEGLAWLTGRRGDDAESRLVRALVAVASDGLRALSLAAIAILEGRTVREPNLSVLAETA